MTTTTTSQHQGPPTAAPVGDAAGSAMTPGGSITVASSIVIFVIISIGLLSLQYCFDARDRETHHGAWSRRRRRRGDDADGTAGSNNGATRTRGVDPEVMRALPVTVYRAAAAPASKEDAVECSVCLAELQDGEEARFLPRCGHGFHAECVDMWLASHTTCPLCRLTVTVSKPGPESSQTPAPASALRPLPPEPANLPRNVHVLLGVSDQGGAVTAANIVTDDGDDTTAAAPALVIEIPELAPVPTPTPRDAAKSSPVSARPRSFRRLWCGASEGKERARAPPAPAAAPAK
ncbi:hypothetical protein BDA96_04G193300 [Sorghum bicolor]|uniref:RING-type E3 ubiquitin transferase n=1 Tax=Sorghum bicolor TaxID=4558 RepID=A0A921R549_SORBI|nr:hypothetical protein BDA96_04G193300 [Sorghum bicolor]